MKVSCCSCFCSSAHYFLQSSTLFEVSDEANQEEVFQKGLKPRPKDPWKRGKRPSGYVEIKIAVKHFSEKRGRGFGSFQVSPASFDNYNIIFILYSSIIFITL